MFKNLLISLISLMMLILSMILIIKFILNKLRISLKKIILICECLKIIILLLISIYLISLFTDIFTKLMKMTLIQIIRLALAILIIELIIMNICHLFIKKRKFKKKLLLLNF